ncbi:S-adenosyl-L-methionine-dependent methyltransferase [Kockiozyma suomiensis]|uniref:S-adenosyl-L-methionine-dependent methyltransferase n=1 Tax=Kockiozyma suomiensis TaxID=1337062 RepID=UPI0033441181
MPSQFSPIQNAEALALEQQHVHEIYNQIASHFSQTRYKPWPIVERFLTSLSPGSIGLDIGCGNGKYLAVANPGIYIIATDRSDQLVNIAAKEKCVRRMKTADVGVADGINMPIGRGRFDFAISIAVVHHFASRERRVEAVRTILRGLRLDGGRALIYAWALEQGASRRGWDEGHEQDVMVPWVTKKNKKKNEQFDEVDELRETVVERYYHLYRRGELEEDIESAGGLVLKTGYERDNWWAIACPRTGDSVI